MNHQPHETSTIESPIALSIFHPQCTKTLPNQQSGKMDLLRKKIVKRPRISSPALSVTRNPVSGKVEGIPLNWVKLMDANISEEEQNRNLDAAVNAVTFFQETMGKSYTNPQKFMEFEGHRRSSDRESADSRRHSRSWPTSPSFSKEFGGFQMEGPSNLDRQKIDQSLRLLGKKAVKAEEINTAKEDDVIPLPHTTDSDNSPLINDEYWLNLFDETFDLKTLAIILVSVYLVTATLVAMDSFPFFQCRK
jgi:hypothetical protein